MCKIPSVDRNEQERLVSEWEVMRANVIRRKDVNNIVGNTLLNLPKDCVVEVLPSKELEEQCNKSRYFAALFKGSALEYIATKASYVEYYSVDDKTIDIQYGLDENTCQIILGRDFK
ncbi:MAG: hypothetical protein R3Y47_12480 [Lachnospiraceae bacterium]